MTKGIVCVIGTKLHAEDERLTALLGEGVTVIRTRMVFADVPDEPLRFTHTDAGDWCAELGALRSNRAPDIADSDPQQPTMTSENGSGRS
jgi:hypothetical protein